MPTTVGSRSDTGSSARRCTRSLRRRCADHCIPPRVALIEAAELARGLPLRDALRRAALGAGGRFYAPGRVDSEYVALLEEALRLVDTRQQAVHARLLGRLGEALVGEPGGRPEALGAAAVTIARASGTDEALVSALLSRHATLLNPVHVAERIE